MKLQSLATWALFATAALLFVSALPTAQASLYDDAFNVVCSRIEDREKKKMCEDIAYQGCEALEGDQGVHERLTGLLRKAPTVLRGLPSAGLPLGSQLAGVVDEAAKNQSGVKYC